MNEAADEDEDNPPGFVVARTPRNGNLTRDFLRGFEIVGRNGVAHLAYGPRPTAHVFDSRREAEDIARRLGRRVTMGTYDYLVEERVRQTSVYPV